MVEKKTNKKIFFATLICLLFTAVFGVNLAIAATDNNIAAPDGNIAVTDNNLDEEIEKQINSKIKQGTYFLLGVKKRLAHSEAEKSLLKRNIHKLENLVANNKNEITTIEDQLANLNDLINKNEIKTMALNVYITELTNHIESLNLEYKSKEVQLKKTKAQIRKLLQNLYLQASLFFSPESPEEQIISLFAYNSNLSELNQKKQYSMYLNESAKQLIVQLEYENIGLRNIQSELGNKKLIIDELQDALRHESRLLNEIKEARTRLLSETQGKQELYEKLLEDAEQEEVNISLEISRLKENYEFFEQKLSDYHENKDLDFDLGTLKEITQELKFLRGDTTLSWPVSPSLGISAFFQDAEYLAALKVGHNAIDIRAIQGTKVRAAADGIISKVVDNGFGYSYIIISHPEKIVTLYGHISEIQVKENQVIRQGEVIGLSGGMPGTKGSGWLTTGPHLHFEVFKDFKHTDPLQYLPLEFLPKESLNSKYLKKVAR